MARTGRRPGQSGTREAILSAARASFTARGYDATSIRGVAREAGVDPALVHHYFGAKSELFAAAMTLPEDPARVIGAVVAGPTEGMGERIARTFLGVWDHADRAPIVGLLGSAATNEQAGAMLREFVEREIVGTIADALDGDDARLRASLAAAQLVGVALVRYVVRAEPIASADAEELVARLAPVLQLHLTGRPS